MRRATLVKRTFIKSRAEHTWSNFRSRLNNIITNQAAAQRIGAQSDTSTSLIEEYPKATKSVDKMYKKTKQKLTHFSKINEKIFDRNRHRKLTREENCLESEYKFESDSEHLTSSGATCSESIKSSTVSSSVGQRDKMNGSVLKLSASPSTIDINSHGGTSDHEAVKGEFNTLKSAFRRSKYLVTEVINNFHLFYS